MKDRLLYNQRSRPLVVSKDNAALTHDAWTSIQPEESPPGGQERESLRNVTLALLFSSLASAFEGQELTNFLH